MLKRICYFRKRPIQVFPILELTKTEIMKSRTIENTSSKNNLNKLIAKKIAEIQTYEDDIPGVIIVFQASDFAVIYMSARGRNILGITNEELINLGPNYHTRFFNPEESSEYAPKLIDFLRRNANNEIISLFQQVRPSPQNDYSWYMTGLKVILRDETGIPILILGVAIPVDPMHELAQKAQRVLNENNFLKKNFHLFETLTKREVELLKLFAKGNTNESVARQMFISEETVATHRKNIKRKINCKTNYDCTYFAQAFDLI